MKAISEGNTSFRKLAVTLARAFVVAGFIFGVFNGVSQTAPILTIAQLGTNQFSITITNGVGGTYYDLEWTPVLANPSYPWTFAEVGTPGQTNFMLNMGAYQTGFFRALIDTNSIPLWEAADPNNPGAGILTVFIDSPANGSTLTQ
jgi:hypothetical protein